MKNLIIISIVFVSMLSQAARAQTNQYHEFEENVTWRFDLHTNIPLPPWHCVGDYYYHYYFSGDTLIDNSIYKKLYRSHVHYPIGGHPGCVPYYGFDEGYVGGVREDVSNNQVFYRDVYYPEYDTLMYDYNLVVGDTLETFLEWCLPVIDSIDSVSIDGSYRKRWHYTTCVYGGVQSYFIQGYGGTNGLMEWITNLQQAKLICIKKNDQPIYETGVFSNMTCKDITASIENPDEPDLKMYPIPANSELTIEGISSIIVDEVEVINQFGQRLEIAIDSSNDKLIFDLSTLANGLYFVRITAGNQLISRRFSVGR